MKSKHFQKFFIESALWNPAKIRFLASAWFIGLLVAGPTLDGMAGPAAANTTDEIRQLREQLADQTKRIDHLYEVLGPQLTELEEHAAQLKKQANEDVGLAMKEVFRSKDTSLTDKLIFIPHSSTVAVAATDRTVKMIPLQSDRGHGTLTGLDGVALCLATSADGSKIFAGTTKGSVFVCGNQATNFQQVFNWKDWPVDSLAASPDSALVVCACNGKYGPDHKWIEPDESLLAIEVVTGKIIWSGKAGRCDFQALSFSGDGKTVAVVQAGIVALLDAKTGRTLRKLEHEKYPSGPLSAMMSRDGKLCAAGYAPNDVGIWDASEGKCLRLLGAHSNWVVALAFSPDGALLASSAGDTTASVWDVATGKEIGRLRFGDGAAYVNSISISDDGRWVAAGRRGEFVVLEMPQKPREKK